MNENECTPLNGSSHLDFSKMVEIAYGMLRKEIAHHKDMTDRFHSLINKKYFNTMDIVDKENFKKTIKSTELNIISLTRSLISYKKYAENNK